MCTIFGTRLGEKGRKLLEYASRLFGQVQYRLDAEPLQSGNHWRMLKLAVLNNQACIYYEFAMYDEATDQLDKLAKTLLSGAKLDGPDWKTFYLTLKILARSQVAAAA